MLSKKLTEEECFARISALLKGKKIPYASSMKADLKAKLPDNVGTGHVVRAMHKFMHKRKYLEAVVRNEGAYSLAGKKSKMQKDLIRVAKIKLDIMGDADYFTDKMLSAMRKNSRNKNKSEARKASSKNINDVIKAALNPKDAQKIIMAIGAMQPPSMKKAKPVVIEPVVAEEPVAGLKTHPIITVKRKRRVMQEVNHG